MRGGKGDRWGGTRFELTTESICNCHSNYNRSGEFHLLPLRFSWLNIFDVFFLFIVSIMEIDFDSMINSTWLSYYWSSWLIVVDYLFLFMFRLNCLFTFFQFVFFISSSPFQPIEWIIDFDFLIWLLLNCCVTFILMCLVNCEMTIWLYGDKLLMPTIKLD